MRILLVLTGILVLAGCSTLKETTTTSQGSGTVDYDSLQRSLGLERSVRELGYEEKNFNTCTAGFGYANDNCRHLFFVVLHFRMRCRDSNGTTSEIVTESDTKPFSQKTVKWKLGGHLASSQTDEQGYAQIRAVYPRSPKGERLKLSIDKQFVYVRAGELTQIVTPASWCNGR